MRKEDIEMYLSLEPEDKLKFFYQIGNINNRTLHVRGRIDNILIVRRWSPRKGWIYETMQFWGFQVSYSAGTLKVAKRKDGYEKEDQSGIPTEGGDLE